MYMYPITSLFYSLWNNCTRNKYRYLTVHHRAVHQLNCSRDVLVPLKTTAKASHWLLFKYDTLYCPADKFGVSYFQPVTRGLIFSKSYMWRWSGYAFATLWNSVTHNLLQIESQRACLLIACSLKCWLKRSFVNVTCILNFTEPIFL